MKTTVLTLFALSSLSLAPLAKAEGIFGIVCSARNLVGFRTSSTVSEKIYIKEDFSMAAYVRVGTGNQNNSSSYRLAIPAAYPFKKDAPLMIYSGKGESAMEIVLNLGPQAGATFKRNPDASPQMLNCSLTAVKAFEWTDADAAVEESKSSGEESVF